MSGVTSGVAGAEPRIVGLVTLGLRRCLCKYEAEDADRGKPGLGEVVKVGATCCCCFVYEWLRLRVGLSGLDVDGDC